MHSTDRIFSLKLIESRLTELIEPKNRTLGVSLNNIIDKGYTGSIHVASNGFRGYICYTEGVKQTILYDLYNEAIHKPCKPYTDRQKIYDFITKNYNKSEFVYNKEADVIKISLESESIEFSTESAHNF